MIQKFFGYNCEEGLPKRHCQTGKEYDCVCSSGLKEEGQPYSILFPTPVDAWEAYYKAFSEYSNGKEGVIYWRRCPILLEMSDARYTVTSRLAIS